MGSQYWYIEQGHVIKSWDDNSCVARVDARGVCSDAQRENLAKALGEIGGRWTTLSNGECTSAEAQDLILRHVNEIFVEVDY